MSKHVSTEHLSKLVTTWQHTEPDTQITALLTELLKRRQNDLLSDGIEALRLLRRDYGGTHYPPYIKTALAALDRLLTAGEK